MTLPAPALQMTLPIPARVSIIRTHSNTYTHPKRRNRGTTYKPAAETEAARPQERERLGKRRDSVSSDSNCRVIRTGGCRIHRRHSTQKGNHDPRQQGHGIP